MPSIVGIGRYVVKGVHGTIVYTGLLSSDDAKITDLSYTEQFAVSEHKDGQDNTFAVTAGEVVKEINVTFTPVTATSGVNADTVAGAKASLVLPSALGEITVASTPGGITAGVYNYISGSIRTSTDSTAVIDMVIRKYPSITATTPSSFIS